MSFDSLPQNSGVGSQADVLNALGERPAGPIYFPLMQIDMANLKFIPQTDVLKISLFF